ncbi:MAG TPA: hypothetical protein VFV99_10245 [Kofleriaceae bacterium]|nr:hypothetical protein [Kofleriaceae bacterium]
MVNRVAACLGMLALAGCDYLTSSFDTNDSSGDQFPIFVDNASGAVVIGMQEAGDLDQRQAVLDVMSPMTVIDRGPVVPASMETTDVTILGAPVAGDDLTLPRAKVDDLQVTTLHPCDETVRDCTVGTETAPRPFNAVLGLNAFTGDALRLALGSDQIFILPDVAGSDLRRARSCDSVMSSPFSGGGTLVIGGTEIGFPGLRIAIDSCMLPRPINRFPNGVPATQAQRGVDALFVLSTGVGTSLLSRSAYQHLRELDSSLPAFDALPEATVFLPSGPVVGNVTTLASIALVSNSGSNPRAPCRQMWASHLLALQDCLPGDDCPCQLGETFCGVPAVIELAPLAGIPLLIVPDTNPTLQSLRAEIRPDRPEVDGILGADAIEALELDIDFAHNRLLGRCTDRAVCGARVALPNKEARSYLNGCLDGMPGPIVYEP